MSIASYNRKGSGSGMHPFVLFLSSPDGTPLPILTGEGGEDYMATLEFNDNGPVVVTPDVYQNSQGLILIGFKQTNDEEEEFPFIMLSLAEVKTLIKDLQASFDNALNELKA